LIMPFLSRLLPNAAVNAYAEDDDPVTSPITLQLRYDNGLPIVTATTITAIRNSPSRIVLIRNGRMLSRKRIKVMAQYKTAMQTTLSVPISTFGGAVFADTISAMKLAVMPIMAIKDTACRIRVILNVAPRAP